jgi:hypothetical protein
MAMLITDIVYDLVSFSSHCDQMDQVHRTSRKKNVGCKRLYEPALIFTPDITTTLNDYCFMQCTA